MQSNQKDIQLSQGYQYRSRRKIQPIKTFFLSNEDDARVKHAQRIKSYQQIHRNTLVSKNEQISAKSPIKNYTNHHKKSLIDQRFVFDEYFTPFCDEKFFNTKFVSQIMSTIFGQGHSWKWREYKLLLRCLPKPKLFNQEFANERRQALHKLRDQQRFELTNSKSAKNNSKSKTKSNEIGVGEKVYAFCPICQHFHIGVILSQYKDAYIINFEDIRLGALKIPEQFVGSKISCKKGLIYGEENLIKNEKKIENQPKSILDFSQIEQTTNIYLYTLSLKESLIKIIKNYHDMLELQRKQQDSHQDHQLSHNELQQYGWVGASINMLSMVTKCCESKLIILTGKANSKAKGKQQKNCKMPLLGLSEAYHHRTKKSISEQVVEQSKASEVVKKEEAVKIYEPQKQNENDLNAVCEEVFGQQK